MKFSLAFLALSYGAVPPEMRFNKLPYEQTSPGNRAANAEEVKIQDWAEQYRKFWGEIDQLYREVLGANTDQVITFRNGKFRQTGNVKMHIVADKPSTEMKMKAIVAQQRGALFNFPKDKPK